MIYETSVMFRRPLAARAPPRDHRGARAVDACRVLSGAVVDVPAAGAGARRVVRYDALPDRCLNHSWRSGAGYALGAFDEEKI